MIVFGKPCCIHIGKYMVMAGLILLLCGCSGQITGGNTSWNCEGRYCPPKIAQVQPGDVDLTEELSVDELAARLQREPIDLALPKGTEIAAERR